MYGNKCQHFEIWSNVMAAWTSDIKTKTVLWFWFTVEADLHGDECRCFEVQLKVTATWTELHEDTKSNLSSIKTRFHLFLKDISQWSCHKGGENWWRFYKTFLSRNFPIPRNGLDCFFSCSFHPFLIFEKRTLFNPVKLHYMGSSQALLVKTWL